MPLQPMSDTFDVNVEWEEVPESDLVPEGVYELVILAAELGWTGSEKLAVELTYQVAAGGEEGRRLRSETLTLGSDEDNQAMQPETRKKVFGWMNLKRLCNAVGVRYEQSLRMTTRQLVGQHFMGQVKLVTQPEKNRDGTPNQYAGNQQNRIMAYYPIGHAPQVGMVGSRGPTGSGSGSGGHTVPPTPQRRMSAAEMLAQAQAQVQSQEDVESEASANAV